MPRGSPFTALCRQLAGLDGPRGADLHVHSTASDGAFTPSQVVAFAHRAKLEAVALTDHDTLAGLAEARRTAAAIARGGPEVVTGVEITCTFAAREVHLLGYFVRDDHPGLGECLARACERRRARFRGFVALLLAEGVALPECLVAGAEAASASLGRRHVCELLVRCGAARSRHAAWQQFVGPLSPRVSAPCPVPVGAAIALVRDAGGASSLAHPPPEFEEAEFVRLRDAGLDAVEAVYPWRRSSPGNRLRALAEKLGLLVTGGGDCHGPDPAHRAVGAHAITTAELERLRERAGAAAPRVAP